LSLYTDDDEMEIRLFRQARCALQMLMAYIMAGILSWWCSGILVERRTRDRKVAGGAIKSTRSTQLYIPPG